MTEANHDPAEYRVCMRELMSRLQIYENAMRPFADHGLISVANCELAALQLRKMYELVGFASLSANRGRYAAMRRRYERDWNLADILNRIERINPNFLPISLVETWGDGSDADPHLISTGDARFEKSRLLEDHGRLGSILHARNPYSREIDYRDWTEWMIGRGNHLIGVMECHGVVVDYQKTMYRVAMRDAETEDVLIAVMNFEVA